MTVHRRARSENWPSRKRNGSGGGFEFPAEGLPGDVCSAIVAHEVSVRPEFLPAVDVTPERVRGLLAKWQEARPWNQELATKRLRLIEEAEAFVAANPGLGRVAALDRFCAALDAKKGGPDTPSRQTLYRWAAAYKQDGLVGLLSERGGSFGRRLAMSPEIRMYVQARLHETPHIRPAKLHSLVQEECSGHIPSAPTIYRFVKRWKAENHELYALMEDPRRWKNSYQAAHGDKAADVPYAGHTWEMDSTPADVITADGKRCCIVGAIDINTRRLVLVVSDSSKSTAIAACIRKGLLLWGVPVRIRMDNGKDYTSKHITAVLCSLGVERLFTRPYHGEEKPFIERALQTLTHGLHELVTGYIGHSVAERGALRERRTWGAKIMEPGDAVKVPLTRDELIELTERWLARYEQTPHGGLNQRTPASMAEGSRRQPARIRDERVLDILLAPVARRVVGKKGIQLDGATYTAPELVGCVKDTVDIRRDLSDAGIIHVFATNGKFICKATDAALEGVGLEAYLAARREHNKKLRAAVRAGRALSEGLDDPVTVLLPAGDVERHGRGDAKVVGLQPEADTPAIREARKAEQAPVAPKGLADELIQGPELPANVTRLPGREQKPAPRPVFDTAIEAYDWVCGLETDHGGLSAEDAEWKAMLESYPEVQDLLRLRAHNDAAEAWKNF